MRHPLLHPDTIRYQREAAREVFAKYHAQMRRLWITRICWIAAVALPLLVALGFKWF